jgi:ribosomal protein S18 acetylase RimI-like enzyme
MARTVENLKRYGAEKVYVRTYRDNAPAVGLYQKMGFHVTHEDYGWTRPL